MAFSVGKKRAVSEINVTPLVDVVLVLLIAIMVLTPLAEKQMYLRIPELAAAEVSPEKVPPDQTVLRLRADGRVLLNREEMTVAEAMQRVRAGYEGQSERVLFFDAEDRARYEDAVRVMDLARQAGVKTIGIMTGAAGAGTVGPDGSSHSANVPAPVPVPDQGVQRRPGSVPHP